MIRLLRWGPRNGPKPPTPVAPDRKSTRLNSSHLVISYAVFCLKKKKTRLYYRHLGMSYAVFCLEKNRDARCLPSRFRRAGGAGRPVGRGRDDVRLARRGTAPSS